MDLWRTYAYISNGTVRNIVCYLYDSVISAVEDARAFTRDNGASAVDVTHTPVQIGDTYKDGNFYRNGNLIEPLPTVEQQTEANTYSIAAANDVIDELIIAITPAEAN